MFWVARAKARARQNSMRIDDSALQEEMHRRKVKKKTANIKAQVKKVADYSKQKYSALTSGMKKPHAPTVRKVSSGFKKGLVEKQRRSVFL